MKLLEKLKNALFEEEYVEVEEKPKKNKPKKESKIAKKEIKTEEEKPIAKKIVLPERKEIKVTNHEDREEPEEIVEEKKEYKFPMVSDNEFMTSTEKVVEEETPSYNNDSEEVYHSHQEQNQHKKLYGIDDMSIPEPEYGTYEKEDRTYFKPSPIISPIYGILDKNYRKEEIIPKREVRLTSSYSRENLDVDAIRNKAYGTAKDEIKEESQETTDTSNFMDQDLLDLTNESDTPEIKKVTVGDAEEYFNDLGLEYNVDYKDGAKEKIVGRRYHEEEQEIVEKEKDETINNQEITPVVDKEEYEEKIKNKEENQETDENIDDDNLFDLIDSMYDKE